MRASTAVRTTGDPLGPKFLPPRVAPTAVARPRLCDRLVTTDASLVCITASAGYGKSTLLAQWADVDPRPVGWYSVDSADNDPVVLIANLARLVHALGVFDDSRLTRLGSGLAPWDAALAELADAWAVPRVDFGVVIDDVHLVDGPSRNVVLPTLAAHVPSGSVCVLSSRIDPPIPTSRLRLSGRVMTMDAVDLALRVEEARALLDAAGMELDGEGVERLVEHAEGWAAGLYIAALTLRDSDDVARASAQFTGSNRLISGYLSEEVLAALPGDDVDFLLQTSVLQWMSGDVCDAVLGRVDSGSVLARLAADNRFVVPLDTNGEWYRYHHLFAETLLAELHRRDAAMVDRVALGASRWFMEHGDPNGAVVHAMAAHDRREAASLIWRLAPLLLVSRYGMTVQRWLDEYSDDEITASPELALSAAWLAVTQGDVAGMQRYTSAARLCATSTTLSDGTELDAAIALLHALSGSGGLAHVRENAARAVSGHVASSPFAALALVLQGSAMRLLGHGDAARTLLEQAVEIGAATAPAPEAHALAQLARIALDAGESDDAVRLANRALATISSHRLEDRPVMVIPYAIAAVVHGQQGSTRPADEERRHAIDLLARVDDLTPYLVAEAVLDLAVASAHRNDPAIARALLDDAARRLRRLVDVGILEQELADARKLVAELEPTGNLIVPLTPAEIRVLQFLPTHLSFGDIGRELFVSRNTVKSQAMAVYRKLGVTSRAAAVDEARELGLLAD